MNENTRDDAGETDAAQGDTLVRHHLDSLRALPYGDSYDGTRNWLDRVTASGHGTRRASAFTLLASYVRLPRVQVAMAASALLLIVACQSPLSHDVTLAHVITGSIAHPPAEARRALSALPWIDQGQLQVLGEVRVPGFEEPQAFVASGEAVVNGQRVITASSRFIIAVGKETEEEIGRRTRSLEDLRGVTAVHAEAIRHEVREPAYRVVLQSVSLSFEPEIEPDEVERRVEEHLALLRLHGIDARYEAGPPGTRTFWLELSGPVSPEGARAFEQLIDSVQRPRR